MIMTRFAVLTPLFIGLVGCKTQPATLPNSGAVSPGYAALHGRELELSQQAALDAAKSAREATAESEKLQKQISALKSEVEKLSVLAAGCTDIAKKSDLKRAAAAAKARKEAEEKKAAEAAAAVALPTPTASTVKGDYSKSDAPPGYYPEHKAPAPAVNEHH
jgi:hypothetical protein